MHQGLPEPFYLAGDRVQIGLRIDRADDHEAGRGRIGILGGLEGRDRFGHPQRLLVVAPKRGAAYADADNEVVSLVKAADNGQQHIRAAHVAQNESDLLHLSSPLPKAIFEKTRGYIVPIPPRVKRDAWHPSRFIGNIGAMNGKGGYHVFVSVPSGAHKRALLQPLRKMLIERTDWQFTLITPGAPWNAELFPASEYPRCRFSFFEIKPDEAQSEETFRGLMRLFAEKKPRLALTTTTGRDECDRPILKAARESRVRSVVYIESWDNVWKMARKREEQVMPDHILLWNETMKEHLGREFPRVPQGEVSVVGSPRLDIFKSPALPPRAEVFRRLGLDPAKKVLHFSTVELYDMRHVAEDIASAKSSGALPRDLQLLATTHPGGNFPKHKEWADRLGFSLHYVFGRDERRPHPDFLYNPSDEDNLLLMSLFKEDDILVNFSSTVALESMLADTPTIGVMYGKPFDWLNWQRSAVMKDFREHYAYLVRPGGIRIVKNRRALVSAVNAYLGDPRLDAQKREKSALSVLPFLDGRCSERAFEAIRRQADRA